jgi:aspartyl protease family protein
MGLTHVTVTVGNPADDAERAEVRCLVDSGAVYSLVPRAVLERLGMAPHSTREFVLANGDVIGRCLATATFEYEGRRGDSMVIVGEPGDDALLGGTGNCMPRRAGVQDKGPSVFRRSGLRGIMPAATYSPIQFPIQYHRRYQA